MFLVTTADERSWNAEERILFLGEWCKLFERRQKWSRLDYEVLPYHWRDPKRLYRDCRYLNDLYEEVLVEISEKLNEIHGVDHSVRYWRLLIGLWLLGFIYVLYDRYQSIMSAVEYGKVENTLIIESDRLRYVPQDFGMFNRWAARCDGYNHYLYGRIIEHMNRIPFEYLNCASQGTSPIENTPDSTMSFSFRNIFKRCLQYIPQLSNKIVIVDSYLSHKDDVRLNLSLKQFPYWYNSRGQTPESKVDLGLRTMLNLRSTGSDFQELLMPMVAEQIPTLYMEGYAEMCRISAKKYPRYPKAMFNAVAYDSNEAFKFFAAYNIDHNVKLLGIQHGGGYGSSLLSSLEDHQIKISDVFYSWGWKSDIYEKTRPLVAASLNAIKDGVHPKKEGRLLLVEMALPRYSFIPQDFCTSSSGFLAYLDEQFRFVNALSAENKKLLLVRLYMSDYQWSQKDRWKNRFPDIECSDADESMMNELNESRLAVGTYNATTYLQSFVANFPTILFWNPEHWKVRASAQPYFDKLRHVGILYDTPELAAEKVNQVSDDPISWWEQPDIQTAKDQFCFQFARTSDNWLGDWTRELRSQMRN